MLAGRIVILFIVSFLSVVLAVYKITSGGSVIIKKFLKILRGLKILR